jgi:hypothetical protein
MMPPLTSTLIKAPTIRAEGSPPVGAFAAGCSPAKAAGASELCVALEPPPLVGRTGAGLLEGELVDEPRGGEVLRWFTAEVVGDGVEPVDCVPDELPLLKRAVNDFGPVIVKEQVALDPAQAPDQPANVEPDAGSAVAVTVLLPFTQHVGLSHVNCVPLANQLALTVPAPAPVVVHEI